MIVTVCMENGVEFDSWIFLPHFCSCLCENEITDWWGWWLLSNAPSGLLQWVTVQCCTSPCSLLTFPHCNKTHKEFPEDRSAGPICNLLACPASELRISPPRGPASYYWQGGKLQRWEGKWFTFTWESGPSSAQWTLLCPIWRFWTKIYIYSECGSCDSHPRIGGIFQ